MNLRTMYGDKIADQLLTRKLHRVRHQDAYRYRFVHQGQGFDCCVVGAANLLAARAKHLDEFTIGMIGHQPTMTKCRTDFYTISGRPMTYAEEQEIEHAMGRVDDSEYDLTLVTQ